MFSRPLKDDGWYIGEGVLLNGDSVDLLRDGAPVDWEKPHRIFSLYKNDRWRKYMMNLWWKTHYKHRKYFTEYLCREWNDNHTGLEKLTMINLYYVLERTQLDLTKSAPQEVLIWQQDCSPKKKDEPSDKSDLNQKPEPSQ